MMKTIEYKIQFFSEWHCGSGLAAGADIAALVIKDKSGFPFVPGKTMKGLIREAAEEVLSFKGEEKDRAFYEAFGFDNDNEESKKAVKNIDELNNNGVGCCFFSNATLNETLIAKIDNDSISYLYRSHSSTAIDENGIAREHSLRSVETVIPCELYGTIDKVPESIEALIEDGLKFIKRLGTNRNRGLGRCQISIIKN